jgi:hypothetical protein
MKPLFTGWRLAAVCSLLLAPVAIACGAGAATDSQNYTDELEILFPEMHTAFEPDHDYRVPAKVEGVKSVTWKAEPKDAVSIDVGADRSEVTFTMKKFVKEVKITATSGNLRGKATLTMTEATPEQWKEGSERYNNGVVWKRGGRDGGGGRRDGDGGRGERKVDPQLSCTNCHNKGGKGGNDIEHTPMQTAGFSDEQLITIFSEGKKPEGVEMRTTTAEKWGKMHKWTMEPEEKQGIIVYLRSLEPESQGEVDWGGRGGRGGGRDNDEKGGSGKGGEDRPSGGSTN